MKTLSKSEIHQAEKYRTYKEVVYMKHKHGYRTSKLEWALARSGDAIRHQEQILTALNITKKLGYEMIPRKEVTHWKWRTRPRIKIWGRSYVLIKK